MIGRLKGMLVYKQPPHLMVDVGGVGYELEAPMTTFYQLPEINNAVELFTHLAVRDDAHLLFGFASFRERVMFRTLIKVNGVGAKMALVILSGMDVEQLKSCVEAGDTATLTRLPGVGKKTAERLIVELRDRLATLAGTEPTSTNKREIDAPRDPVADAVSGLIALGYKPQEASRYVNGVETKGLDSEQIIREALKSLVKG
jgi:Holliday junction DNA helicase RuvA